MGITKWHFGRETVNAVRLPGIELLSLITAV